MIFSRQTCTEQDAKSARENTARDDGTAVVGARTRFCDPLGNERGSGGMVRYCERRRHARVAASLMTLFLLIFIFTAGVYTLINLDHHCTGEDCPVCRQIRMFWDLVSSVAGVLLVGLFSIAILPAFSQGAFLTGRPSPRLSPVGRYDRMND